MLVLGLESIGGSRGKTNSATGAGQTRIGSNEHGAVHGVERSLRIGGWNRPVGAIYLEESDNDRI
jgi:hypothetical protein